MELNLHDNLHILSSFMRLVIKIPSKTARMAVSRSSSGADLDMVQNRFLATSKN